MNYKSSEELDTMKRLINYGKVNEAVNTGSLTPRVEYSTVGADGKTYGIIRECNKFYIKVAPKKNTEVLAEDYDYIGGFMNKKENEYPTYSIASKQFDLKMMSLNEAYSVKAPVTQFKETEECDWQIQETKEMRSELNRFNQILGNVQAILSEDKSGFMLNHTTVPEAPASHPSSKKVNSPYTDVAVAKGDKEFTKTETSYKTAGGPFNKDGEVTDKEMQSDKNPSKNTDAVYTEKAKYVPDNTVADKKPGGGKAVKMNENKKRTIKLTENQVLTWNKNKDFMDKSNTTEIGSSAPFGCEVNEEIIDVDDVAGMDTDVPFPEVEDEDDSLEFELELDDDMQQDMDDEFDFSDEFHESKNYNKGLTNEEELHDFGKHPTFTKQPMTLPPNKEVAPNGARDWNDKSVEGEKQCGTQIGSGAPFDEKVIDMIADSIMGKMGFSKKA